MGQSGNNSKEERCESGRCPSLDGAGSRRVILSPLSGRTVPSISLVVLDIPRRSILWIAKLLVIRPISTKVFLDVIA